MAKSIQLKTTDKPATPTGGTATPLPRVPPAAVVPPGVAGDWPLPVREVVAMPNPSRLTDAERSALEGVGWRTGQPVPEGLADAVTAVRGDVDRDIQEALQRPPIDPATPPLAFETVAYDELSPQDQAKIQQGPPQPPQGPSQPPQGPPPAPEPVVPAALQQAHEAGTASVRLQHERVEAPMRPLERPAPAFVPPDQAGPPPAPAPSPSLSPPAAEAPAPSPPAAEAPAAEAPAAPASSGTRAPREPASPVAPLSHCPHCQWDLSRPDTVAPSYEEKLEFLQSILGEKPYLRTYELLGGNLSVTFRTLTTREVDACFQHGFKLRDRGLVKTDVDFWEVVNRFRLYLQLQRVRSTEFDHELPEGLDKARNPNAGTFWEADDPDNALDAIEDYMLQTVIPGEILNRVLIQQCAKFNRLAAKLEVMVPDSDFWKATASPA